MTRGLDERRNACYTVFTSGNRAGRATGEKPMTINELAAAALVAVTARGYRDCDDTQFVARNLCKAGEEYGEAARGVMIDDAIDGWDSPARWCWDTSDMERTARAVFDNWNAAGVIGIDADTIRAELPDVLIPLLCAAAVLGLDKESYWRTAAKNCRRAEFLASGDLFAWAEGVAPITDNVMGA